MKSIFTIMLRLVIYMKRRDVGQVNMIVPYVLYGKSKPLCKLCMSIVEQHTFKTKTLTLTNLLFALIY